MLLSGQPHTYMNQYGGWKTHSSVCISDRVYVFYFSGFGKRTPIYNTDSIALATHSPPPVGRPPQCVGQAEYSHGCQVYQWNTKHFVYFDSLFAPLKTNKLWDEVCVTYLVFVHLLYFSV